MAHKDSVHDLPQRIPGDTSRDYELEFIAAVRQGLAEVDNGQTVSVEEIERDLSSWLIKYDSHILPEQT